MLVHLRVANVLIPGAAVLERIGLAARVRARKRAFQVLADGLTDAECRSLEALLVTDPAVRRSRFAWLRDCPEAPAPSNMVALLDRLDYVRGLGVGAVRAARIHPARLARLVEEGGIMTAQHIADLEPTRRAAILVAQVAMLEIRIADATLAMFAKYMGSLFTKARNRDERRFQATKRDVAKALLLFRRTIAALKQARETGEDGVAVVDREIGMERLDGALPIIASVAEVADQEILVTAAERYTVLRRFSPRFLEAFSFQSSTPHDPVLAAIEPHQGNKPRRQPQPAPAAAGLLPAGEVAQADLRERAGGPAPVRDRRPGHAARPPAGQRHLGGRQPRLARVRGPSAAGGGSRWPPASAARPIRVATSPTVPPPCTSA